MGKLQLAFLLLVFVSILVFLPKKINSAFAQTSPTQCKKGATQCKDGFVYKCVVKKKCNNNENCTNLQGWEKTSTLCAKGGPSPTSGNNPVPNPTTPPNGLGGGKIVLYGNPDGQDLEIYSMNADGSELKQLTNNNFIDWNPSFSPDGQKIAFASDRDGAGKREIYVMKADGTGQTRLTHTAAGDTFPAFSPDGQKIVYSSDYHLYIMDSNGQNQKKLYSSGKKDVRPSFSPDGQTIVFMKWDDSKSNLFTINSNGQNLKKITNNTNKHYWNPSFSPAGDRIIFFEGTSQLTATDRSVAVYSIKQDGNNKKKILAGSYRVTNGRVWIRGLSVPPSITPSITPTPTLSPTPYPNITAPASCSLRTKGDATCDNLLDDYDLNVWACQISNKPDQCIGQENRSADFNLKDGVDLNDFEIWRENAFPAPLGTIAPTQSPAELVNLPNPAQYAGKTINEACGAYQQGYACTARCTLMSAIQYQAYYMMTENPSSTTSDNNCSQVVPENITYLSACCYQQPLMSTTVPASPTIEANVPTQTEEPTITPIITTELTSSPTP